MNVEMDDAVVFVYTLGVMVSGYFVGTGGEAEVNVLNGLIGVGVAVLWTAYFSRRVSPRVFDWQHGADEDEEGKVEDSTETEEDEAERKPDGPAPWDQ